MLDELRDKDYSENRKKGASKMHSVAGEGRGCGWSGHGRFSHSLWSGSAGPGLADI